MKKKFGIIVLIMCFVILSMGSLVSAKTVNSSPTELLETKLMDFPKYTDTEQAYGFQSPEKQLRPLRSYTDELGNSHYSYQQQYLGVPIYGKYMNMHVNKARKLYGIQNNTDTSLQRYTARTSPFSVTPKLTAVEALDIFLQEISEGKTLSYDAPGDLPNAEPQSKLVLLPEGDQYRLVYELNVVHFKPFMANWKGFVDATNGSIIRKQNILHHIDPTNKAIGTGIGYNGQSRSLNIYRVDEWNEYGLIDVTRGMANDGAILTLEEFVYTEDGELLSDWYYVTSPTLQFSDPQAVDAHYNSGIVYDYFKSQFNRDSYNNLGMDITSVVHMTDDQGYILDNAYWSSWTTVDGIKSGATFYGDGDMYDLFESPNCYSCALDVVAHEMTHGLIDFTAGLEYYDQPGALNESIADIVGSIIEGNWTMMEDTGVSGRSLSDPSIYGDPMHMNQYVYSSNDLDGDYGGVHTNSGIPNHAAYKIATKLDDRSLNGKAILAKLVYRSLTTYLNPASEFADFRDAMLYSIADIGLPANQRHIVQQAVRDAWAEVGLSVLGIYGEVAVDDIVYPNAQIKIYSSAYWNGTTTRPPVSEGNLLYTLTTDQFGFFEQRLPLGYYVVKMSAPGYVTHEQYFEVGSSQYLLWKMDLDLQVPKLHGAIVSGITNQGLAGATLNFYKKQLDNSYSVLPSFNQVTVIGGFYEAKIPSQGTYRIKVSAPNYVDQTLDNINYPGDSIVHNQFVMVPIRGIRGTVSIANAAYEGAKVDIYVADDLDGGPLETVYTDGQGKYEVNLPDGSYLVIISEQGYVMGEQYSEVNNSQSDLWQTVNVNVEKSILYGTITDSDDQSIIVGAIVNVYQEQPAGTYIPLSSLAKVTGIDGSYEVEIPSEGVYRIVVTADGYATQTVDLIGFLNHSIVQADIVMPRDIMGDLGSIENGQLVLEKDHIVNNIDFSIWLRLYRKANLLTMDELALADLSKNGTVDVEDYDQWISYYVAYRTSR